MKKTISAVIPVLNVALFVRPTLESLSWCDEVVIVDMFSTDETEKVCSEFPNVSFYERKGLIFENVNYGINVAKGDWVLRLDSDEVIKTSLKEEILNIMKMDVIPFDGYECQSDLYFMGYSLKYGFARNNWRTTFFKKGFASYPALSEHEEMNRKGSWGRLNEKYEHFTNPTISTWVKKINYYTDQDIARLDVSTEKISLLKTVYRTIRWFQRYYIYPHQAFRDGAPGFVVACIAATGMLLLDLKHWEKQESAKKGSDYVPPHPLA